jgi:hypothetical protein
LDTREVTKQYRLNKWTEIVRECLSSGQTISTWCADQNIDPKRYYYWLKRVRMAAFEALPSIRSLDNNPMVPVTPPVTAAGSHSDSQESSSEIVIRFGTVTLEIRNHASTTVIENTLRALQNVR